MPPLSTPEYLKIRSASRIKPSRREGCFCQRFSRRCRLHLGNGIPVVKRKFFNNNHLNLEGGLEPLFRVLFSAIFQVFSWVISIRGENRGFLWKENCCKSAYKFFLRFSHLYPFSSCGNPSLPALEGWINGCSMPIDRNDLPNHLFGILDLDLSEEVIVPAIIAPLKQSRQCIASSAGAWPIFQEP